MKQEYLPIADLLNKYQTVLDNFQFHRLCIEMIPQRKIYEKYIKGTPIYSEVEKQVRVIADYFNVAMKDAYDYYRIAGDELVSDINSLYGIIE